MRFMPFPFVFLPKFWVLSACDYFLNAFCTICTCTLFFKLFVFSYAFVFFFFFFFTDQELGRDKDVGPHLQGRRRRKVAAFLPRLHQRGTIMFDVTAVFSAIRVLTIPTQKMRGTLPVLSPSISVCGHFFN